MTKKKPFEPVKRPWSDGLPVTKKRKRGKAAAALDAFKSVGVTSDGKPSVSTMTTPDLHDILKSNASRVVTKEQVAEVLDWVFADEDTQVYSRSDLKNRFSVEPTQLVTHPSFIRGAARRGTIFYVDSKGKFRCQTIKGAVKVGPSVVIDESIIDVNFYLKPIWYENLLKFVNAGLRVLLIGPAGTGKSEGVQRVFLERSQELLIVSCNPSMTADDFEGRTDLREGPTGATVTEFTPAAPTIALERGYGLLLDEADAVAPEACYALYRILDGRSMHILRKGYESRIEAHENFRAVGTQNTEGRGDGQGLFHGRAYQDEAMLDRWNCYIRVTYPEQDQEALILRKHTGIEKGSIKSVVESATLMRKALEAEKLMMSVSLRRTKSVCANLGAGMSPLDSWNYAVLNRATAEDRVSLQDILKRVYGSKLEGGV
jgi:MoxR-like ATPase